jgi:hypothetical protein
LGLIHDQLIKQVLPILYPMHRFLRDCKSPLQSDLRKFFRRLCEKHPSLLEELRRQEPILATELEHDIALIQTPDVVVQPPSPVRRTPFRSPLLSRIARTPQTPTTVFLGSATGSPMSVLSQHGEGGSGKSAPIPFSLDEEE